MRKFLFMASLAAAAYIGAGAYARADEKLDLEVKRLVDLYHLIESRYANPVDPEQAFYQGAIPGMLRTLDPHSAFLDKEQFESLKQMQRSTEKGFGSVVSLVPGRVIVLQTLPESPSARAGLSPGDEIVAINGYQLARFGIEQLVALLGEARQDKAELMVVRPGQTRLLAMTLVPAEMADPSVQRSFFLAPKVGYIKVVNFEMKTANDLRRIIDRMGGDELKGLVLDFRGNPGGLVDASVQMAALFLQAEQGILWVRGKEGPQEQVKVPAGLRAYAMPISVLIDGKTASAAEIVAGALQDHDRATIIGEPSFGKGIVQSVFNLSEGTAVALTTAHYLTPSGRSIQRPLGACDEFQLMPCSKSANPKTSFTSDAGRPLESRGGIVPDETVLPRAYTRFEAAMEASTSFLEFAQQYLQGHSGIAEDFEVTPEMLDEFQLFLSKRYIRPDLSEWSSTLAYIRSRLKQEVINLALGVAKGDEVEAQRDPQIQAAVRALNINN